MERKRQRCLVADFSAALAASGGPVSVAPVLGLALAGPALVALAAPGGAMAATGTGTGATAPSANKARGA